MLTFWVRLASPGIQGCLGAWWGQGFELKEGQLQRSSGVLLVGKEGARFRDLSCWESCQVGLGWAHPWVWLAASFT